MPDKDCINNTTNNQSGVYNIAITYNITEPYRIDCSTLLKDNLPDITGSDNNKKSNDMNNRVIDKDFVAGYYRMTENDYKLITYIRNL